MRKSGVITVSDEASRPKCASMAPVFRPNITLCWFCDGVTDKVVPGQTCTSPPLERRKMAVSGPAVTDDAALPLFPASARGPSARTTDIAGAGEEVRLGTPDFLNGVFACVWPGLFPRCTTRRFPAASH